MMRPMKTLTFIALAALLASCTEEISEELKNSQKATSQNTTTDLSDSKITLAHKMDERMSFNLHKAGTVDTPCELAPPDKNGFDASGYYRDPSLSSKPQVIDCILDAQEQDLFLAGAKLELHVDAQLCEYVSYSPFKFIERAFGNTKKTVYRLNCAASADVCGASGMCDKVYEYADAKSGLLSSINFEGPINYDGNSCQFDYTSSDGPNCDEGKVYVEEMIIDNSPTGTDADGNPVCPTTLNVSYDGTTKDYCGGSHGACFGGPAVDHYPSPYYTATIYENTELKEFTESWEIQAPLERQGDTGGGSYSNKYIANFSRICSDTSIAKGETAGSYGVYNSLSLKGHHVESIKYDPMAAPYYAASKITSDGTTGNEDDYETYSENPWRAHAYGMNPYYAFRCLDQARDVKAQIRLFIRDWDRTYDKPISSFAMVSDIGTGARLMDSYDVHDQDEWNDIKDWDDWFAQSDGFVWTVQSMRGTNPTNAFKPAHFPRPAIKKGPRMKRAFVSIRNSKILEFSSIRFQGWPQRPHLP